MISVCLATYNGERYIKEQISSILSQLGPDDEIVVSDDHSKDNTVSIIKDFNDNRIKVVENTPSEGRVRKHQLITRNFFNAICHCKGDFIFLSDQDDVWLPSKVEVCLRELQGVDLVIHNAEKCDKDMESMNEFMWKEGFRFRNYFVLPHSYMGCCMAFRREMLAVILPPPKYLGVHDYWIGIICELLGKVKYIEQPLIKYRMHGDNNSLASGNNLIQKFTHRAYLIWHYLLRYIIKRKWKK